MQEIISAENKTLAMVGLIRPNWRKMKECFELLVALVLFLENQ
jgi:hypothetical protein